MPDLLASFLTPALMTIVITPALLVVFTDWRLAYVALALQYVAAAVLVSQLVILPVVAAKLIAGLLVAGILAVTGWQVNWGRRVSDRLTESSDPGPRSRFSFDIPTGLPFRAVAAVMVLVAAGLTAGRADFTLPGLQGAPGVNFAVYVLVGLGLLNLGLTDEPMNAGLGLVTLLTGFELFYAALEPSLAIVALLAAVQFGVALAVGFLALRQYASAGEGPPG